MNRNINIGDDIKYLSNVGNDRYGIVFKIFYNNGSPHYIVYEDINDGELYITDFINVILATKEVRKKKLEQIYGTV